jgi:hypothetical protein
MKPVTPFDNFPSFGNAGARQAPGDAKYAQGFLAADTLPAEWANYFFHGSTKGISDLNTAVRSIWLELNSVLTAYNITADASQTDQLYQAIEKRLRSLYPVGTIYQNADSNKNPGDSDMLGFGTWAPITDKFLAARGSTNIGASGGAWSKTLTEANIPQHNHGGSTGGANANVTAEYSHTHYVDASHDHTVTDPTHAHGLLGLGTPGGGTALRGNSDLAGSGSGSWWYTSSVQYASTGVKVDSKDLQLYTSVGLKNNIPDATVDVYQTHHTHTISNYGYANPTAISIIPTYVGVYTWKRTA